jgi:lactoylglutathione lyase
MKIDRLDHLHVYSVDPEASARFYQDVLGAEPSGNADSSHGGTMHFLRLGGLALVLAPYPPGTVPGTPAAYRGGIYDQGFGVAHFGLQVENLMDAVASVRQRGATILAEPKDHAGLRFAYIAAPDGVIIELLEHSGKWTTLLGPPLT